VKDTHTLSTALKYVTTKHCNTHGKHCSTHRVLHLSTTQPLMGCTVSLCVAVSRYCSDITLHQIQARPSFHLPVMPFIDAVCSKMHCNTLQHTWQNPSQLLSALLELVATLQLESWNSWVLNPNVLLQRSAGSVVVCCNTQCCSVLQHPVLVCVATPSVAVCCNTQC